MLLRAATTFLGAVAGLFIAQIVASLLTFTGPDGSPAESTMGIFLSALGLGIGALFGLWLSLRFAKELHR